MGDIAINQDACLADFAVPLRNSLITASALLIISAILLVVLVRIAALITFEEPVTVKAVVQPAVLLRIVWTSMATTLLALAGLVACLLPGLLFLIVWHLVPMAAASAQPKKPALSWRASWWSLRHQPLIHLTVLACSMGAVLLPLTLFGPLALLTLPFAALLSGGAIRRAQLAMAT